MRNLYLVVNNEYGDRSLFAICTSMESADIYMQRYNLTGVLIVAVELDENGIFNVEGM